MVSKNLEDCKSIEEKQELINKRRALYKRIKDLNSREISDRQKVLEEHYEKFRKERETLVKECGEIGHKQGRFHDNGVGTTWYYCSVCDERIIETIDRYDPWDM